VVAKATADVSSETSNLHIRFPKGHMLPQYLLKYRYYSRNLPRVAKVIQTKYPHFSLIDVGANVGDTVALIRQQVDCPILCIEGNVSYVPLLKENLARFPNTALIDEFLGDQDQEVPQEVISVDGTGRLSSTDVVSTRIYRLDTLLEKHTLWADAKVLKIDTDGFDNRILRGSQRYLARTKPILFIEWDPNYLKQQHDDGLDIFDYLSALGYTHMMMYANTGEYICSLETTHNGLIEEFRDFYLQNCTIHYADLLIFHKEDEDLFEACRLSEMTFFRREKGNI
jgi:FkbM family methyltransferase